jgi:UDP-N-acetylmuramoyl-tripeptide--D-alanyl-D-alanine ligase
MIKLVKKVFHASRRVAANLWLNKIKWETVQIAITGSYGKTSTSSAIYKVMSAHAKTLMTDLNLDTIYNVPITALQVRDEQFLILELGIDRPGEMDFHLEIATPDISVLTGISPVHSDEKHLGSLEAIIQQKGRIIEVLRPDQIAILNYDDPNVRAMVSRTEAQVLWYGLHEQADYHAKQIEITPAGTRFKMVYPEGDVWVETPLLGAHQCANLLAAAAVAHQSGVPNETIVAAFKDMQSLVGRGNAQPGPLGTTLLNDALRANPASSKAGLKLLRDFPTAGKRIAVLGEMGELGEHAISKHAEVGETAAETQPDLLITVGKLTHHTAESAAEKGLPRDQIHDTANVHAAAAILKEHASPGDVIYLKGSLMRHLERIPLILEDQNVGCKVIFCPFYHQCTECEFLEIGYK